MACSERRARRDFGLSRRAHVERTARDPRVSARAARSTSPRATGSRTPLALRCTARAGAASTIEGDPESFSRLARVHRKLPRCLARSRPGSLPTTFVALLARIRHPSMTSSFLNARYRRLRPLRARVVALRSFGRVFICAEINEMIPPPIKFAVRYDPSYRWQGSHFFGQSLSQLHELCGGARIRAR